jgi:hypothetical protein
MNTPCSVDGCNKPRYVRGYCIGHYRRWRLYGNPLDGIRTERGKGLKFLETISPSELCINWPFGCDRHGYGSVKAQKQTKAHRFVCEKFHGPCPPEKHGVAHSCGNRLCVNPAHLRWATFAENEADKELHGTRVRGDQHPSAKLTDQDVRSIRTMIRNASYSKVASAFGISITLVFKIVHREAWKHVQ